MRPEVYFLDYGRGDLDVLEGLKSLFKEAGLSSLVKGRVAVKVHIGEWGNITHVRPSQVKAVVDAIKDAGGTPFLTETTTLYPGRRFTAEGCRDVATLHGFTDALGAPFIVADAPNGFAGVNVSTSGLRGNPPFKEISIASAIAKADALILVVHAKGHLITGFGGALKHAAMGCVTKTGKAAQHAACRLVHSPSKCDACGLCVEMCPFKALRIEEKVVAKEESRCLHCNTCLFECPRKAWSWAEDAKEKMQEYLAYAAAAVFNYFSNRVGIVSFVQDVTPLCDCASPAGVPLVPDIGVLASLDPVAIDAAALHLIDAAAEGSWCKEKPPNFLSKVAGVDAWIHIKLAEELGVGSTNYRLVEL
ncbi:MAG: DUF362 domain-containing protein [Candidatus Nezhaarchaeota archaeon]|nr:DUF362 domain-containing protein [Candidatus Nezhaarchaeota archaeon]